jgi:NAD(P)-dependent dehydrogenase (short-subunit alcohol dehydrogenase family)
MPFDWHHPGSRYRVAVFGSGGGIGSAFVEDLASRPGVASVLAYSRAGVATTSSKVHARTVDITSESALEQAAAAVDEPLDIAVVATGTLHSDRYGPERRLSEVNAESMLEVYRINTVAPALIAKHFLPLLARDRRSVFAALSARVGSIADNRLGGWTSYRASKAALNMVLKTFAIEHGRRRKESIIVGLHPGTVDTGLSKPFSGNVPEGKLFSPAQSARYLLDVIDGLEPDDSGGFFAWDGQRIDY